MNLLNFAALVSWMAAAIQGSSAVLVDLTVGSILRALIEATAGLALWIQGLILQLLATTRASTSNGSALDTWMADFNLPRLPAVQATGPVTFARFTTTNQATIPAGSVVQTSDGTQQYTAIADTNQAAWNAGLNAYIIAAGTASCTATVRAVLGGAAGNAAVGAISTIVQTIANVDTVNNAAAFLTGKDAESDAALRTRFTLFLNTLSDATVASIQYAVTSLQSGATCSVVENLNYAGGAQQDYFYCIVDDGSGSPPGSFITACVNAINAVRPIATTFGVYAPSIVTANVALTIVTGAGYVHATVAAKVATAIQTYINSLAGGTALPYTRLIEVAYDTSPGVVNVSAVTLNGGTADLPATIQQRIMPGTVTVT